MQKPRKNTTQKQTVAKRGLVLCMFFAFTFFPQCLGISISAAFQSQIFLVSFLLFSAFILHLTQFFCGFLHFFASSFFKPCFVKSFFRKLKKRRFTGVSLYNRRRNHKCHTNTIKYVLVDNAKYPRYAWKIMEVYTCVIISLRRHSIAPPQHSWPHEVSRIDAPVTKASK
jgi:hypothetical protein